MISCRAQRRTDCQRAWDVIRMEHAPPPSCRCMEPLAAAIARPSQRATVRRWHAAATSENQTTFGHQYGRQCIEEGLCSPCPAGAVGATSSRRCGHRPQVAQRVENVTQRTLKDASLPEHLPPTRRRPQQGRGRRDRRSGGAGTSLRSREQARRPRVPARQLTRRTTLETLGSGCESAFAADAAGANGSSSVQRRRTSAWMLKIWSWTVQERQDEHELQQIQ